jgi:hypothetical protein
VFPILRVIASFHLDVWLVRLVLIIFHLLFMSRMAAHGLSYLRRGSLLTPHFFLFYLPNSFDLVSEMIAYSSNVYKPMLLTL